MPHSVPLNALRVFEAAARHLNLMHAAEELNISQSAVSRHIQNLEQRLGVTLFVRGPRGLQFTEAGDTLAAHAKRMFTDLHEVTQQLCGRRTRQLLRVAVARSYATRVLARHIQGFVKQYPWIDLYLDGMRHLADLHRGEADAAIRVGDGKWPDLEVQCLGEEHLTPVCAPELLASRPPLREPGDLRRFALLHYAEQPQWQRWLHAVGERTVDPSQGIRFSETVMMLEAAQAAQGVAIARLSLVQEELGDKRLIRPFETTIVDSQAYYFCATERGSHSPMVKAFRDWLMELTRQVRVDV